MSGSKIIKLDSHFACCQMQCAKLDGLIATHAWIRSSASTVFGAEIIQHLCFVFTCDENYIMRDSQTVCHQFRFFDILVLTRAVATFATFYGGHIHRTIPRCHGKPHNIVPLLLQQIR